MEKKKTSEVIDEGVGYQRSPLCLALRRENSPISDNHGVDRPVVVANRNGLGWWKKLLFQCECNCVWGEGILAGNSTK